jgi:uncharacterized protein (TIGR03435 family)
MLTITNKLLLRMCLGLFLGAGAQAAAPLTFEVATIKPSAPLDVAAIRAGTAHIGTKIDATRVDIGTTSLFRLICTAYRLRPYQVTGPDWLKTTMYDIQARIPNGATTDDVPEMLRALLMERFGLKIHHDSKEQAVYALVVAKGGPKLTESAPGPAPTSPAPGAPKPDEKAPELTMTMPTTQGDIKLTRSGQGISVEMPGGEIKGKVRVTMAGGSGAPPRIHLESSGTSMKSFAEMLSTGAVDRPVVDLTGLTGNYEVALDMSPEDAMNAVRASVDFGQLGGGGDGGGNRGAAPGGGATDPSGASVFASIQNLGLRLEARKLPLDLLVVDHIEKMPTAN